MIFYLQVGYKRQLTSKAPEVCMSQAYHASSSFHSPWIHRKRTSDHPLYHHFYFAKRHARDPFTPLNYLSDAVHKLMRHPLTAHTHNPT